MPIRTLKVGDELFIGGVRGRGGHGAYIVIEKINAKSMKGTEKKGSYSPGTRWTIGTNSESALITFDGSRVNEKGELLTGLMNMRWGRTRANGQFETVT